MIVLPWYLRFAFDCTIIFTPLYYFHHHPSTHIFEYFQNKRRIVRRNDWNFQHITDTPTVSVQQTKKLYQSLGFKQ